MNNKFADMSVKDRAAYFGRMVWSELPIIAEVRNVIELARLAQGTSLGGKVSLIHGEEGIGKQVACDSFFRVVANTESGTYNGTDTTFGNEDSILDATWVVTSAGNQQRRNLIKIDISPRVTANGLLADMIRGLTNIEPPRMARHDVLLRSIKKILVGFGTEVLVLDNAHRAVERNISIGKSDAGDIIAEIAEKTGVEIVLVGTDLAKTLFADSKKLALACRLFQPVHPLSRPAPSATQFLTLLEKFQNRLPLPRRSDLTSEEVTTRLFTFCDGNIEKLASFLQTTLLLTLREGGEFIDMRTLAEAHDKLFPVRASHPNPFREYMPTDGSGSRAVEARQ